MCCFYNRVIETLQQYLQHITSRQPTPTGGRFWWVTWSCVSCPHSSLYTPLDRCSSLGIERAIYLSMRKVSLERVPSQLREQKRSKTEKSRRKACAEQTLLAPPGLVQCLGCFSDCPGQTSRKPSSSRRQQPCRIAPESRKHGGNSSSVYQEPSDSLGGRNAYCTAVKNFRSPPRGFKVMPAWLAGVLPEDFHFIYRTETEGKLSGNNSDFRKHFWISECVIASNDCAFP